MKINSAGWCDTAVIHPSPHFNERPENQEIELIVIHNISLPAGKFATGDVKQYVSCKERAWHAGVSEFQGRQNCNDFSIGIELEGTDDTKFESVQYEKLASLIDAIAEIYPIKAIVGHSHIAPGRKTDPGPCFSWLRLIRLCENGRMISFPYGKKVMRPMRRLSAIRKTKTVITLEEVEEAENVWFVFIYA